MTETGLCASSGLWALGSEEREGSEPEHDEHSALEMSANLSQVGEEGAWEGELQMAFLVADCAVLLVTFLLGSAANVFVVHAVRRHKSLRTPTNALLVNLALVDLLRCATDCPLLLLIVLRTRGRADLGLALCGAQLACFSLNCGAQLLTVAGISVERHRAVTRPFEGSGGGGERRKRVAALIPCTWAASALASALCALFARDSPVYALCRGVRALELRTYGSFGRYVLLPAWCACLVVIAVCYGHIFVVVRAHSRKIFDKGVSPPSGKKGNGKEEKANSGIKVDAHETDKTQLATETNGAMETVVPNEGPGEHMRSGDCSRTPPNSALPCVHEDAQQQNAPELMDIEGDDVSPANLDARQRAHEDALRDAQQGGHGGAPEEAHENAQQGVHGGAPQAEHENAQKDAHENAHQDAQQTAQDSAPQGGEVMGAVCMMPSFANRERVNKKKESKLAKRSGYIIFTFLICWLPLIGTIVLSVFQDRNRISAGGFVQLELEVLAVCIACMTSLTNPIIYAAVNPQFRNEFFYLKNKCKALCTKP